LIDLLYGNTVILQNSILLTTFRLNGGQIARDWITITSLMWSAFQILQGGIQNDPKFTNPLQSFVFLISPCINPDGYEYSKNVNRNWMKNRQNYVNLDRNWNFHWTVDWQLNDPKDAEYSGTSPFSESETQLYSEYIVEKVKNRHAGLDFNSNGERILRTWGYTKQLPKEYLRLDDLGKKLTDSTLTLGTNFTYNSIAQVDQKSGNLCK
jgi:murein tripeptide amidase MpaA